MKYLFTGSIISINKSHPTRVRGLKCYSGVQVINGFVVAPHEGAWIEILARIAFSSLVRVAPHEGAWIEIFLQ